MATITMKYRNFQGILRFAACAAALAGLAAPAAAAPSVGDAYVYRLVNGYNKEVRGQLLQEVTSAGPSGVTYSITPDSATAGAAHTVVVTPEGNWLRHLVESHGEKVEYIFATAYPAYVFPLDTGKTWSLRVKATAPAFERNPNRSVRVDAKVLGVERIRVPAGEYETIKVQRRTYPGDQEYTVQETQVVELDWYAPALGRAVRTERKSWYLDLKACTGDGGGCGFRGDWDIYELAEVRPARR
jgi:hypothetical protein